MAAPSITIFVIAVLITAAIRLAHHATSAGRRRDAAAAPHLHQRCPSALGCGRTTRRTA